jgi:hypothetical protein
MVDVFQRVATEYSGLNLWDIGRLCRALGKLLRPGAMRRALIAHGYDERVLPKPGNVNDNQSIRREFFTSRFFEQSKKNEDPVLSAEIDCPYDGWKVAQNAIISYNIYPSVDKFAYLDLSKPDPTWSEHVVRTAFGHNVLYDFFPNGAWVLFRDGAAEEDDPRYTYLYSPENRSEILAGIQSHFEAILFPTRDQKRLMGFDENDTHLFIHELDLNSAEVAVKTERFDKAPGFSPLRYLFELSPNGKWLVEFDLEANNGDLSAISRAEQRFVDLRNSGETWRLDVSKFLKDSLFFSENEDALVFIGPDKDSGTFFDLSLPVTERNPVKIDSLTVRRELQLDGMVGFRIVSTKTSGYYYNRRYRNHHITFMRRNDGVRLEYKKPNKITVSYQRSDEFEWPASVAMNCAPRMY